MKYNDLVNLFFDRSNALQWYWTLYVIVIGGLLAFSSQRQRRDRLSTFIVTILYCFFAYKNLGAIHDVTDQRLATLAALRQVTPEGAQADSIRSLLEPTFVTPAYEGVRNFHIASDVLTVGALWAMELRRKRAAQETVNASHS